MAGPVAAQGRPPPARDLAALAASTGDTVRVDGNELNATWFREHLEHDPAADLHRIDVPVLAITGTKDVQVDPADVARMGELVRGPFEGEVMPDLTHLLRRDAGPPGSDRYRYQLTRPVDPDLVARVAAFLAIDDHR